MDGSLDQAAVYDGKLVNGLAVGNTWPTRPFWQPSVNEDGAVKLSFILCSYLTSHCRGEANINGCPKAG